VAIGDLLATLERDADAEVRATAVAAAAEIARIAEQSVRARDDALAIAVREATEREQALARVQLADVARRRRRTVLVARAAMLARVHAAVRAVLPTLVDGALRARLAAAAAAYGDGVRRDTPTGVVIELPDGTRIDATLDAALDRSWNRLASEAVALVEAEGT
jgi:vacuolar-type H+-ATPase subunit E/Vma4